MKPTKFRVWFIASPPGEPATIEVNTMQEAILAINSMVALRINLEERVLPVWYDDVSGLEAYVPGDEEVEWQEFYDEEGEDFEYYYSNYEEIQMQNPSKLTKPLTDIIGEY